MSQSLADKLAATALSGGNAAFIEDLYGISQLTALDATSDDLFGDFCFTCQPNGFTPINMNGYTFAGKYFRAPRPDIDG